MRETIPKDLPEFLKDQLCLLLAAQYALKQLKSGSDWKQLNRELSEQADINLADSLQGIENAIAILENNESD
ncbi:MAG: hypothetical protein HC785_16370 [Calothrix sp. CSU_2_0]|nr:hypothetical protein [Calothrix sp. CSU_2_0]